MTFQLEPSWQIALEDEFKKPYVGELIAFLKQEYESGIPIYPPKQKIFSALQKTPYENVKVVLVGQDPYHGADQAHGLSFSVQPGIPFPPSLQNIFKELKEDLGIPIPSNGCLDRWAEQGVLLLNAVLTVRKGQPFSHQKRGWERFTDAIITKLAERKNPPIFVLWGKAAQEKCLHLKDLKILPLELCIVSAHPSPFSAHRGFFGSRPFSRVNSLLQGQDKSPINW